MTQPNRIKIIFDGGAAEVYGDIFSDMLTCFANQLCPAGQESVSMKRPHLTEVDGARPARRAFVPVLRQAARRGGDTAHGTARRCHLQDLPRCRTSTGSLHGLHTPTHTEESEMTGQVQGERGRIEQ